MVQMTDSMLQEAQDLRIDRYLHKQMTADEATAFEQDLRTDLNLRQRARFVAQTVKSLKGAISTPEMIDMRSISAARRVAGNPNIMKNPKK